MRMLRHNFGVAAAALAMTLWFSTIADATVAPPRDRILVLAGTVFSITQGGTERKPWVVTIEIQKVLRGEFSGSFFSFTIHSPAESGLRRGHAYTVKAVWKGDDDGSYQVDEHQWGPRKIPTR